MVCHLIQFFQRQGFDLPAALKQRALTEGIARGTRKGDHVWLYFMHQEKLYCAYLKMAIVGDKEYFSSLKQAAGKTGRVHWVTGDKYKYYCIADFLRDVRELSTEPTFPLNYWNQKDKPLW